MSFTMTGWVVVHEDLVHEAVAVPGPNNVGVTRCNVLFDDQKFTDMTDIPYLEATLANGATVTCLLCLSGGDA